MVKTGLQVFLESFPSEFSGLRAGILCHAPSVTPDFRHIIDIFSGEDLCSIGAVFGPQHGLYGQTQDNMIEWEGTPHPVYGFPVYSLYGKNRIPTPGMLAGIDFLVADLQDVGARLYTYVWTLKNCMEACAQQGIPLVVLDRPNPIAPLPCDGPVLDEKFFTFVGGASVPLCHRMTIAEIALWIYMNHIPSCDLRIFRMEGWKRSMFYSDTGLPWILPSPNMPSLNTAIVYPGMVLFEAMNISEGRGTTIPFELFGAPFIDPYKLLKHLNDKNIPGCAFRIHNFIPTFNKYSGLYCHGLQIHVTDRSSFRPVGTALEVIDSLFRTSGPEMVKFIDPPYEYEERLIPFDILSGDQGMREALLRGTPPGEEKERWKSGITQFEKEFRKIALYND